MLCNKTVRLSSGKPPGIQSSSGQLDLKEIDRQIEEALGDTMQGLSIGMVGMELGPIEETDLEDDSGEESAWDVISFVFTEEGYDGDKFTNGENCPEPQAVSSMDNEDLDSVPDLQLVSDTDESTVSEVLNNDSLMTEEESDSSEGSEEIVTGPPDDFSLDAYENEVPNGEVRLDILWKEELACGRPDRIGSAHADSLTRATQPIACSIRGTDSCRTILARMMCVSWTL
ncbi:hypothetical protein C0993_008674 [Termitomyces sp. T159_Od127]|nr:hypothetical protein C0993_008674 [Termitomyces sp. T159_Od127]